jgi:GNAT superfamily N-acetyltransferase
LESELISVSAVSQLRFVAVGQDDPLAQPLLDELAVEYATRYDGTVRGVGKWLRGYPAAEFEPPAGGMLVGLLGGVPVTGGAFRRFDDGTAELKRIWTDARHRRRGHARALLAALEREIAAQGYRRVYLTTGNRQPEAEALYLVTGYSRLPEPLAAGGQERSDRGNTAEGEVYPMAFAKDLE